MKLTTTKERNIILSGTHEYRPPPQSAIVASAAQAAPDQSNKLNLDMTSRFLGLVVVPGQYITRIEVEERNAEIVPP